jgi:hypothetical protein
MHLLYSKNFSNFVDIVKKAFLVILSLVYMVSTMGTTIHLHYCMGKVVNWGLTSSTSLKCDNCGMEKSSGNNCCHDQEKTIKIEKDQKNASGGVNLVKVPLLSIESVPPGTLLFAAIGTIPPTWSIMDPLFKQRQPDYLLFRKLLI